MGDSPGYGLQATGYRAEDGLIFDAGKLHEQLSGLLQLYLARASDPDAVAKCSAKDAIACAKALTQMMSDLQSGKPASVSKSTTWPRLESRTGQIPTRVGGAHQRRSESISCSDSPKSRAGEPGLPKGESSRCSLPATRYSILESALATVLSTDQESHLEEPYQRFIARADRLCKEVRKRLDAASLPPSNTCPPSRASRDRRDQHLPAEASAKAGPTFIRHTAGTGGANDRASGARAAPRCPT